MKKALLATTLLCAALLVGCGGGGSSPNGGGGGTPTVTLQSISIAPPTPTLIAGTSQQFTATGHFSDNSTQDLTSSVTWSSSATSVVTISASGLAQSVGAGNATITAAKLSISGNTLMTVNPAPVVLTSIAVSPSAPSIPLGTLQQFTATGSYSDGSSKDLTASVSWTSTDPKIVSLDSKGMATATGTGTVNVSATSGTVSGKISATVNAANVVSLKVQPGNTTIANGTTVQLAALATFNDGSTLNETTTGVAWSSSDMSVATIVPNTGFATSKAPGTTIITATLGNVSITTNLTVSNVSIQSIAVSPANNLLAPGLTERFAATGTFSDGTTQNISNDVNWSSDNAAAATISNTLPTIGVATAAGPGVAHITATYPGTAIAGSTLLNVSNATLQAILLTPGASTISPANILQFTATGKFSDGTTQPLSFTATWKSSDSSIATINSAGLATGVTAGTADITAIYQGIPSAPITLTVNGAPLTSLSVKCSLPQFAVNTSQPCSATGTFADSSTQTLTPVVHWTSSQNSVATISNTAGLRGDISGVAPGTSTITAYLNGIVGTTDVTVTNAKLTSIDVAPGASTISLGGTQAFVVQGTFDDGSIQNLTSEPAYLVQLEGDDRAFVWDVIFVNWTSSDTNVAVINKAGVATSTGVGTATMNATLDGVTGTTTLTVQ